MIDFSQIQVRLMNSVGIAYGEPMVGDDIPWDIQEEIAERIIRDDAEAGECEAGGQRYEWRKTDADD